MIAYYTTKCMFEELNPKMRVTHCSVSDIVKERGREL